LQQKTRTYSLIRHQRVISEAIQMASTFNNRIY